MRWPCIVFLSFLAVAPVSIHGNAEARCQFKFTDMMNCHILQYTPFGDVEESCEELTDGTGRLGDDDDEYEYDEYEEFTGVSCRQTRTMSIWNVQKSIGTTYTAHQSAHVCP
jgi:hypothetical protein